MTDSMNGASLPEANRFFCLPGCGLCCSYRVLMTEEDRQRLGAATSGAKPWDVGIDGQPALRRTPEFCLFLDAERRCSVYEDRPDHCRAYPYLGTRYDAVELDVDMSCPGLGQGEETLAQQLKALAEADEGQYECSQALEQVRELLRAQRRYASRESMLVLGLGQLDEMAATWYDVAPTGAWTMGMEQRQPILLNVDTEDSLTKLLQAIRTYRQPARALVEDKAWIEGHFGQPRWNTRLSPAGKVDAYRFWAGAGVLHVEGQGGAGSVTDLTGISQIPWDAEALVTRAAYLRHWLGRQLLRRLATNLSVAALVPGSHLAVTYLKSWLDIDCRLAVLAPALAQARGRDAVDGALALEAVRGSDGLLRAWCESARLGTTS